MLSPVLENTWNAVEPRLKNIQSTFLSDGRFRSPHVVRVTQLDAELLDQELLQLLLEPIRGALALINVCCHLVYYIMTLIENSPPSERVLNQN